MILRPSRRKLYRQARKDPAEYRRLLREHGLIPYCGCVAGSACERHAMPARPQPELGDPR